MNPKSVNDLDPKLREAYERVMGSNFTPKTNQAQNPTTTPSTPPQSQPIATESTPTTPATPTNQQENTPIMQTTQVFTQNPQPLEPAPVSQPETQEKKEKVDPTSLFTSSPSSVPTAQQKKLNMLPLLFAVGAILFFGTYVIIWAKVFGLF